ncbi:unnamed protein product [Staurois parvus]|uniref:N-acetyltransferase domain-containing protein n=1 Tax=Staurois parvus TaxID=386267 RepID=A0ABN9GYR6_9NEOB|nr:unnamed protein product [Staurois parvus]
MADYHIRLYKDSDYETVRDIFALGFSEHYPVSFCHALSLPRVRILILVVFLLALMTTGSSVVSFIAAIAVIFALLLLNREIYFSYIRKCLADDMLDIRKTYLQRDGCCFWVAESGKEIVGTVAAAPFPHPGGQNQVELKRLSVPKKHRGKGIGKALVSTVIDFAQKFRISGHSLSNYNVPEGFCPSVPKAGLQDNAPLSSKCLFRQIYRL